MDISSPIYRKAFNAYLRYGISIEASLKAAANAHPTPLYVWRTRGDEKVRSSHAGNDGVIFAWDFPPATGHPGEDFGCRCTAEPYYGTMPAGTRLRRPDADPPIEPVYPELYIIPLLRTPQLIQAWRVWVATNRDARTWELNPLKSQERWQNRIEDGEWTPQDITRTIRDGKRFEATNERSGGEATRYELDGKYLVRDNETNHILQLSGKKHIAKNTANIVK